MRNTVNNIIYKIAADQRDPSLVSQLRREIQKRWGVTRQTVSRITSNRVQLSPQKAIELLDVLRKYGDFQMEDLFEEEEPIVVKIKNAVKP